jgi:ATP/maltotriose-dependent transcriptional regulator MalT
LVVYGDVEAGRRFSDESWALAEPLGESLIRGYSAAVQGYVLLEAGRPAEAIELLHRAAGGPGLTLIGGAWRGIWYEVLTRCHLELGDTSAALATVRRTRALAEEVPVDLAAMSAERSEALTTMAADEPYGAVELARSALARAETMRSPLWVASCNELVGRTLAVNGDDQAAAIAFDAASAGYDKLGSHRLRDRVDGELRQLGRTIHRRTRPGHRHGSGLAALTGRELEVAELIRAHSTNREIAGELFLSLKTVDTHVRHIFDKLGVSSRADIARTLEAAADSP